MAPHPIRGPSRPATPTTAGNAHYDRVIASLVRKHRLGPAATAMAP